MDVSVSGLWVPFLGFWEEPLGSYSYLLTWPVFSLHYRNAEKILGYLNSNVLSRDLIPPHVNFSHLTTKDYSEMYNVIMTVKENQFSALGLDPCLLEDELDKVPEQAALFRTDSNPKIGLVAGAWEQTLKTYRVIHLLISKDALCT